jgi:cytoskeletal protein CcmA (bactofilin family)
MWKPDQSEPNADGSAPVPAPAHPVPVASSAESHTPTLVPSGEPATIGKGLVIRGEITGTDSLVIDGRVEGTIHLEGNRVTIGRGGQAAANITAREVVVLGKVRGSIVATDRLDIRAEGGVVGDLSAPRISIEDGAFFKGAIDIRKVDPKMTAQGVSSKFPFKAAKPDIS